MKRYKTNKNDMASSYSVDCDMIDGAPANQSPQSPTNGPALVNFGTSKYRSPSIDNELSPLTSQTPPPSPQKTFNIVTINVSGLRFQTFVETLERFPNTLLGNANKRRQHYNAKSNEYFFDRHRSSFESIMYYYQSMGKRLKRPASVPVDIFVSELKFFEMGQEVVEKLWMSEGHVRPKEVILPKNPVQRRIWLIMEHPDSSCLARVLAFFSVFVIVVSTVSFCLETTCPDKDLELKQSWLCQDRRWSNSSQLKDISNFSISTESMVSEGGESFDNPFFIVEFTCMCWFTIEFTLRFISSPSKLEFSKSVLNIIDFVAIVPFFVNLALAGSKGAGGTPPFAVLRVFRLVRVFRIFKLSRHSRGLQILGKTFAASLQELFLLLFFLCLGLVLFSSAIYIAESSNKDTNFISIPTSFWYVIITMTTVGYGDMYPVTGWGKLVGGTCAIMGVLVLALPVPVIVANFKHYYKQERQLARMRAIEGDDMDTEYCDDDSGSS